MKIPNGMTEDQVVESIYRVVDTLASKFRFGYHSSDDMRQEGARFAINALNSGLYDSSRPLDNFLYTHVRNRFINYKRDNYGRHEPPCKNCIFFNLKGNTCQAFDTKQECKKFTDWEVRKNAKQSLMRSMDIDIAGDANLSNSSHSSNSEDMAEYQELINKIDNELPYELRSDYLRILDGQKIPKPRKQKVREAIQQILLDSYGDDYDN